MAACRGARIEWFSDCSNHGGAFFTPAGFRSQAPCQHFTRDITLGTRITEAYPSIFTLTWLGMPGGSCARVPRAVFLQSRQHKPARWFRESPTLCHWKLAAIRCAARTNTDGVIWSVV